MPPGPTGSPTNSPSIDLNTLVRGLSLPANRFLAEIGRITILSEEDEYNPKKMEVGLETYRKLGLAGQIAEKFLQLPYRKGNIRFKTGKLKGEGLVCTSFAKIFGALWFIGDPTKQKRLGTRSPAAVYAEEFGGALVNPQRLHLKALVNTLSKDRLYAVVTYNTKTGDTRQHIWFLIYANNLNAWVRIESKGREPKKGGKGPGPGIYPLHINKKNKKFYQAWDWGPAFKPTNPDLNNWEYHN